MVGRGELMNQRWGMTEEEKEWYHGSALILLLIATRALILIARG